MIVFPGMINEVSCGNIGINNAMAISFDLFWTDVVSSNIPYSS